MASLMALVLYFQSRTYPTSVQGLRQWASGQLVGFLSTVLLGLQGVLPAILTMGLSNVLVILAAALLLHGTSLHYGRALPRLFFAVLLLIEIPLYVWLSSDLQLYVWRLVGVCVSVLVILLWHAWVIGKHGSGRFAARFTLLVLLALAGVITLRGVTALLTPLPIGMFVSSPMQAVYLASFSFGILLLSIGGILMASERLHRELEQLASKDSLTGAFTRRALFELGDNEIARAQRQGTPLSALMLDLDHFKVVNDTHGHYVGDQVLNDFVQRVQGVLRRPAILGRYGGEEFVVLLPDTGREEALLVAERIRASKTVLPDVPVCQVSIGVASFAHGGPDSLRDLIGRADAGLYRAKELGRNRVEEVTFTTPANTAAA
ncbi:MAG: GGDEF domain-containing protein [Burkholderiales bacterium PBB3]|nr:MAG: GGDEF domain-containing protein [Burkholderiales bacterium PBB3]